MEEIAHNDDYIQWSSDSDKILMSCGARIILILFELVVFLELLLTLK